MRIELLRHGGGIGGEADDGHAALAFPDGGNGRPLLAGLRAHRRIPEWAILIRRAPEGRRISHSRPQDKCCGAKNRGASLTRVRASVLAFVNRGRRIDRKSTSL